MPSDRTKRRDDTWTSEELNKALKGSTNDMLRKKREGYEDDRKRQNDGVNGSDRKRDPDRRSRHRDEDERRSRHNKDRGDSPDRVQLTEEDRERLRQERRARREGVKEEKKSRPRESRPVKVFDEDDDGVKNAQHRDRDDGHRSDRKHHRSEEPQKHKDEKDGERRKHRDDREKERRHHREKGDDDNDEDGRKRRHKEEGSSSRRHHDDTDRARRHEQSRDRQHKSDKESKHQSHQNKANDDEEDRERRRQERREKRERELTKDKDKERDKGHRKNRETEKKDHSSSRYSKEDDQDRNGDHSQDRYRKKKYRDEDWDLEVEQKTEKRRSQRHELEKESKKQSSRLYEDSIQVSASHHKTHQPKVDHDKVDDDDNEEYNYEEDFEDYEDDFEDDDDEVAKSKEVPQESEMEGLRKALNEENKLASRRSDRLNSAELSSHRDMDYEPASQTSSRPKTFINFVSAKQRVLNNTAASKTRKRFEDLSKLIELDVAKYDMFDLPPVKEYELYIRSFGRSDTKQAYVQTGDDDIERDVQTEEIESLSKWTQHPPDEESAVGGEGITVNRSEQKSKIDSKTDNVKLNHFLDRVSQFLFTILDEESNDYTEEDQKRDGKLAVSFSKTSSQLGMPNFLNGRQVIALSFCQSEPNYLLSVHSQSSNGIEKDQSPLHALSVVCVWNLSQLIYPYRICGSKMVVTCACFSPSKASIVFAGMYDGSVALWDLREAASLHQNIKVDTRNHLVRFPTYNSAGVIEPENHHSPVVSIVPVYSSIVGSLKDKESTESSSGLSFQLASVEEKGIVNLWVVVETAVSDPAGSEVDLGLAPSGKVKLLRSSAITLTNPNKYLSTSVELKALDLCLHPGDLNHFYVATDIGSVVHEVRFGKRAHPRNHCCLQDSPVPVISLDFSPFGQNYFLAGYEDGTVHLFNTKLENPIVTWQKFIMGDKIITVRWSQSRPAVFFVLDNNSAVFTFDLVENGLGPVKVDRISSANVLLMEVGGDPNLLTPGVSRPAYMALALDNGTTEILAICNEMRQQQTLEEEFLATYIDRY